MGDNKVKADKVLIEVNKYVHPVQVVPQQIRPETLDAWQEQRESTEYSRIKLDIQAIDELLVSLLFGGPEGENSRIKRFNEFIAASTKIDKEEDFAYDMLIADLN